MRYTFIFGSPREEGNTKALSDIVLKRLKEQGAQVDYFDAYSSTISGCRACLGCQSDILQEQLIRYCKHTGMEYVGMLCERHRNLKESFIDDAKARHAVEFAEALNSK